MVVDKNQCGVCNDEVKQFGHEAYGCELCPKWIHAGCAFPNATKDDLKILFKFNLGFDVKCSSCKRDSKVYVDQIMKDVQDIKEKLSDIASNTEGQKLETGIVKDILDNMTDPLKSTTHEKSNSGVKLNADVAPIKHALLLKLSNEEEGSSYTEQTWTEVVKKKLPKKLTDIPVNSVKLTKNGLGYLSFPDQISRDNAASSLKPNFAIESKDNTPKVLFPKIKISGLALKSYCNNSTALDELKEAILRKNEAVKHLVTKDMKLFEILFVHNDQQRDEVFAVAKLDPSIRQVLRKQGDKLFIDLESCKVLDQIHVTQCYTCQAFGHKKNSVYCPLKNKHTTVCLYCSENHLSKDCVQKKKKSL